MSLDQYLGTVCILVNKPIEVLIDSEHFEAISQFRWTITKKRRGVKTAYVVRCTYPEGKMIQLHRAIIAAKPGQIVDHKNMNGLDNRKANIRLCSYSENNMNTRRRKDNKSGYKCVHLHSPGRWRSRIKKDGRLLDLGLFDSPEAAAKAYRAAVSEFHGQFARTG